MQLTDPSMLTAAVVAELADYDERRAFVGDFMEEEECVPCVINVGQLQREVSEKGWPSAPTDAFDEVGTQCSSTMEGDEREDAVPLSPGGGGNFRSKYISRLSMAKVWVPPAQRPPAHQTVVIFDWDDTLLCTSWLTARRAKASAVPSARVACVAALACKLLVEALRLGRAYIVTNAASDWVRHSAAKWAPQMLPLLQQVEVISARDGYARAFPDDIGRWKIEAFLDLRRTLPIRAVTNLIVIGDSEYEMTAARAMQEEFEHAVLKTVKLLPSPSPDVLLKELELVDMNFAAIVDRPHDSKIDLDRRR